MPQVPPLQLPAPCEGGSAQGEQREPHVAGEVLLAQMPLQRCVPGRASQLPPQGRLAAMQLPAQSCVPPGHERPHDRPSQVAVPPAGMGQALHEVVPQLEVRLLATHGPVPAGHWWYPVLQTMPHAPPLHTAVPLGSVGHFVHAAPQAVASLSAEQPVPHLWKPLLHVKSHFVPSQVAVPPAGAVQVVHDVAPHEAMLVFWLQMPPQLCEAVSHALLQAMALSMHAPAHSFLPVGHVPLHVPPAVHVAVPPVTGGHALHDLPHVATSVSLAHEVPHR